MFTNDRATLRRTYRDAWKKYRQHHPLDLLEKIIAHVLELHPEYHPFIESEATTERDFHPEIGEPNPFLHLGMHIALHEQISTNRPAGITETFQRLTNKLANAHDAQHAMMECLGEMLWEAQRAGGMPDEQKYMECLKRL